IAHSLPRKHAVILFQLCTNHAPLNKHLHRIKGKAEEPASPRCPHCNLREEIVHHFLLTCPAFIQQHNALLRAIPRQKHNLPSLLNDPKCITHLFKYIAATERFKTVFGDVTLSHQCQQ
ncbi:hypothetical protein BJ138DRAFT_1238184, partial [Hygrophoropsis aurantiaca]